MSTNGSPFRPLRAVLSLALALALAPSIAHAQKLADDQIKAAQTALQKAFEGKFVAVKLDMPATSMGVNISPHAERPLAFNEYQSRIKTNGTAIRRGEQVMVTKLKATSHLIEFQLGGGGFGTFTDVLANTNVAGTTTGKSQREKNLELELGHEKDPNKRRAMDEELDRLRRDRKREQFGSNAEQRQAAEMNKAATAAKALQGGSRFNLRFPDGVTAADVTPEAVQQALSEWVDFLDAAVKPAAAAPAQAAPAASEPAAAAPAATVHKGSKLAEVAAIWGEPTSSKTAEENGMSMTRNTYKKGARILEATFVEGVLIKYSISEE